MCTGESGSWGFIPDTGPPAGFETWCSRSVLKDVLDGGVKLAGDPVWCAQRLGVGTAREEQEGADGRS